MKRNCSLKFVKEDSIDFDRKINTPLLFSISNFVNKIQNKHDYDCSSLLFLIELFFSECCIHTWQL